MAKHYKIMINKFMHGKIIDLGITKRKAFSTIEKM